MITTKEYVYLGVIGALSFVLAFVLGNAVNIATGIPLTGGIINGIIVGMMLTIGIKAVDKFGAGTILWTIFAILAIPTVTLGPPGVYKIAVGVIGGLTWDVIISIFKRSNLGYILGGAIGSIVIIWGVFFAATFLGLPSAEKLRDALIFLIPFNGFLGAISVYVGLVIFDKKLKHLSVIENLRE
jgi:hypothetical protein